MQLIQINLGVLLCVVVCLILLTLLLLLLFCISSVMLSVLSVKNCIFVCAFGLENFSDWDQQDEKSTVKQMYQLICVRFYLFLLF